MHFIYSWLCYVSDIIPISATSRCHISDVARCAIFQITNRGAIFQITNSGAIFQITNSGAIFQITNGGAIFQMLQGVPGLGRHLEGAGLEEGTCLAMWTGGGWGTMG